MRIGEIIKISIATINQRRAQPAGMIVSAVMATATAYQQQEKKYTKQHMTSSNSNQQYWWYRQSCNEC